MDSPRHSSYLGRCAVALLVALRDIELRRDYWLFFKCNFYTSNVITK